MSAQTPSWKLARRAIFRALDRTDNEGGHQHRPQRRLVAKVVAARGSRGIYTSTGLPIRRYIMVAQMPVTWA
jgi:hypothetical protein